MRLRVYSMIVLGIMSGIGVSLPEGWAETMQNNKSGEQASTESVVPTRQEQAREYLERILYTRQEVENWISGKVIIYGEKYDSKLGWVLADRYYRDGLDNAVAAYSYDTTGARHMSAYAEKPCRINTYGDSFTHCDQVSDHETWQEILAGHLLEPIRNFGVGGYSVYQTYLRMVQEETRLPAKYIIFNIIDDDHYRNLHPWRTIRLGYTAQTRAGISAPTMPAIKVNLARSEFLECPNPCPTPESVYNLTDLEWVCQQFQDDFVLRIMLAQHNLDQGEPQNSYADIEALAREQGMPTTISSPEKLREMLDVIYTRAAIFASMRIIEKVEAFAAAHQKKVLYVLSYCIPALAESFAYNRRFDQEFVDFLQAKGLPYVDLMEAHRIDYARFKLSEKDYFQRYFIGHYNPQGNFFHAFAIKDKVVEMLEPKPLAYRATGDFKVDPELLRFPGRALELPADLRRN